MWGVIQKIPLVWCALVILMLVSLTKALKQQFAVQNVNGLALDIDGVLLYIVGY